MRLKKEVLNWSFLKNKLANYIKHLHESRQKIDEQMTEAEKPLFPFNYLSELKALSTSLGGVKRARNCSAEDGYP